jgi:hypothetical protein
VSQRIIRGSAADYPFDPLAVVEMQRGLDKLRCIADRGMAQQLFDLWHCIEAKASDPAHQRRLERLSERNGTEVLEGLKATAQAALSGAYGLRAEELARTMLSNGYSDHVPDDRATLEAFLFELQKIPQHERQRREPTQRGNRR